MHQDSISASVNLALFFDRDLVGAVVGAEGKVRSPGMEGGGKSVGADGKSSGEERRSSSDFEIRHPTPEPAVGCGD